MEYLSSDKIGIIDFTTSEVSEEPLDEELVRENIGGIGITTILHEKYKEDDPVVLGTGLLTGTLVPGSALGVITARSPISGKVVHTPLTMYTGIELKYSGFDYLVIKGKAQNPVYLWIHDGIADVEDAGELWGKDTWTCTDQIRKLMGDDVIQVLGIGGAGEAGSELAQITCNYWGSADRWGLGKIFGEKKLKLVAVRGMGLIEIAEPEEFVSQARSMIAEFRSAPFSGRQGVGDLLAELGHEDFNSWMGPLVHRHKSCFNTPIPTNTFLFLDEEPQLMKESEKDEPGVLVTDPLALLALKNLGLSAKDAGEALKACAKQGIDPYRVALLAQENGKTTLQDLLGFLPEMKASPEVSYVQEIFSPWCPRRPLWGDFGIGSDESEISQWWNRRQAVAYIFGIHPIFALMSPQLSEDKLLELAALGTDIEFDSNTIDKIVGRLID
ncbi:MAG: hypothetical protein JRH08_01680 [Deltaproteobacteria bacterium]|nr:hypothetical protein [Deltaproteobacteria bacterium]MBW1929523.1 hypothetical protein [Deltaproteobacteria bacterium]MBW2024061.1 hypothetical protein [Deltaproteobacteria bacterium]MBW2124412.1 hypothetical protein [Deltaproteobacteria bacterium]RLB24560.1 MAG: hypothetical protein DRG76_01005 [Deltaproteobacteria bacterium]